MIRLVWLALAALSLQAQHSVFWERKQNTFHLKLEAGPEMEVEFVTPSTFRVRRGLAGPARRPIAASVLQVDVSATPAGARFETDALILHVSRHEGLLAVRLPSSIGLYSETAASVHGGGSLLELAAHPGEEFFGLGARPQAVAGARGLALKTETPFFVSTRGYALWMGTPGAFEFDMAKSKSGSVRIAGSGMERLEYYFAFGPSLKEIWEERLKVDGPIPDPAPRDLEMIPGPRLPRGASRLPAFDQTGQDLLCGEARALVHASLSGILMPAFDLARYRGAELDVFRRAANLGALAPIFQDSQPLAFEGSKADIVAGTRAFRKRLNYFLLAYADEARARGYPILHPMFHQYPHDIEAREHTDSFLLGDELLVAPVCDGAPQKRVYLPLGIWTNWDTGKEEKGRRAVTVDTPAGGVIVFVKNGSILPLGGVSESDPMQLHYYPKSGGEFFLYEPGAIDYSQAHAGPAADIYRLEMESKVDRDYEWVVHNMDQPKSVEQVEGGPFRQTQADGPAGPGQWRYDAANRAVHVGIHAPARSDIIVNLRF
ncbi:MAG: hypothetical protein IANPNBLG_01218 [Bryobacteraceae bacterium]|nr:hypothetical protein [Bryobacteraceae bacterium]